MFRMYGRKVEILKYQVSYQENEEQRTDYAVSEEEAQEIAARAGGSVSALTPGDDAWMDGIEVADVPDTYGEAMKVYEAGEAAYRKQHPSEKELKIAEMSTACNAAIVAGMDVETTQGTEHFSLEETDQINLTTAYNAVLSGAPAYPYHADHGLCRLFTADEIKAISAASIQHKLYHTTLCNHLLTWARRAETEEELDGITYTADNLPEDLAANMAAILTSATSL